MANKRISCIFRSPEIRAKIFFIIFDFFSTDYAGLARLLSMIEKKQGGKNVL